MSTFIVSKKKLYMFDNKEVDILCFSLFNVMYRYQNGENNCEFGNTSLLNFLLKAKCIGYTPHRFSNTTKNNAY